MYVSEDAKAICECRLDSAVDRVRETAVGPDAICAALVNILQVLWCVIFTTGWMANRLQGEPTLRDLPEIRVGALQAHAIHAKMQGLVPMTAMP